MATITIGDPANPAATISTSVEQVESFQQALIHVLEERGFCFVRVRDVKGHVDRLVSTATPIAIHWDESRTGTLGTDETGAAERLARMALMTGILYL